MCAAMRRTTTRRPRITCGILDENGMARGVLAKLQFPSCTDNSFLLEGLPQRRRVALDYQIGGGSRHQAQAALPATRN